jgi:hypothetical protein
VNKIFHPPAQSLAVLRFYLRPRAPFPRSKIHFPQARIALNDPVPAWILRGEKFRQARASLKRTAQNPHGISRFTYERAKPPKNFRRLARKIRRQRHIRLPVTNAFVNFRLGMPHKNNSLHKKREEGRNVNLRNKKGGKMQKAYYVFFLCKLYQDKKNMQ